MTNVSIIVFFSSSRLLVLYFVEVLRGGMHMLMITKTTFHCKCYMRLVESCLNIIWISHSQYPLKKSFN
jgi:hypothetical protein